MKTKPDRGDERTPEEKPMIAPIESALRFRRRVVLAHPDPAYASLIGRQLRLLGWDVYQAADGPEVRRMARVLGPAAVVLAAELGNESGWLTCAKLIQEQPGLRVLLVSGQPTPANRRFSRFVGAAGLVSQTDGIPALIDAVYGSALPAVG